MWYGAAAGVAGLATSDADAQVVYHDFVPDVLIQNNDPTGFPYDFDGDGDPEILFREQTLTNTGNPSTYSLTNRETTLGPDELSGIVGNLQFGYTYFVPLAAGAAIGPATVTGLTRIFQSLTFQGSDPNGWQGQTAYMGVRFALNGTQHFGWVRLTMPAGGGQYTLLDLAYESTPNTAINAGDTGSTAIEPGALPQGYLFSEVAPNPVVGRSAFNVAVGRAEHVRVDVLDVTGRQVATLADRTLPALEQHRIEFDATALPTGVYVVRVAGESFVTTRRVVVAH